MNDADQSQIVKGLYQLHIDGGKKASKAGEKSEGAIGALLKEPNGTVIEGAEISERIKDPVAGPTTAEYKALLAGLKMAREDHHVEYIAVFSDSRTLVNQVNGLWEKKDELATLCAEAEHELKRFKGWQVSWVPRKWNDDADELVRKAFNDAEPEEIVHAED